MLPPIDLHAVRLALAAIGADGAPRGINLALASLADGAFTTQLRRLLERAARRARLLSLEVGEGAALDHFELLQAFAALVRPLGVRFGLEHAGHQLQRIERLYELGLDYVKLDAALVRGVADRRWPPSASSRQRATLLHALALAVLRRRCRRRATTHRRCGPAASMPSPGRGPARSGHRPDRGLSRPAARRSAACRG